MPKPDTGEPFKFPERFTSMTIHSGLLEEPKDYPDIDTYLKEKKFALAADLIRNGFSVEQIEKAVNIGEVAVAGFPETEPKTYLFWAESDESRGPLTGLAFQAVQACYGQDEKSPVGGNFASVGAEMGSQQLALAALIYAREAGQLREIPELDNGGGPLYVVRDSLAGRMFERLMPENQPNPQ